MPQGSTATQSFFVLLVCSLAALFAWATWTAWKKPAGGLRPNPGWLGILGLVFVAYLVLPGTLASRGLLDRYDPLPAPALMLFGALAILTIALAHSRLGTRLLDTFSLAALIGFQIFRLPVELLLHRLASERVIPIEMTYLGRNFDIVTAITALLVAFYVRRARPSSGLVRGWNLVGLALLVNIVIVAVLSTPVPFRHFTSGPANLLPSTFPYVWLPSFLVQAALFGHLLVFRALRRARAPR